ncbi:MAG: 2-polyprenyl-3-methyl-6-methoxy-1,4-benzoquinone monooxygenase [Burkholderiaceae bacterium]|nr:2-polyprenyl-3-methyl-6-methoxy-1,4-benzoquinone monooxygenase [Burkholderiaceae bacterium]
MPSPALADRVIEPLDRALRCLSGGVHSARPMPAAAEQPLSAEERRHAGALIRVDHVGEVCAQALYLAQSMTAGSEAARAQMRRAAQDEEDHLAWTEQRLRELGARRSLLNPLWYAGAFAIGLLAGRAGERVSLGFVVETERQVEAHLAGHLDALPARDARSRELIEQMKRDESRHGADAQRAGGVDLPAPARASMRLAARVMTRTAYHV